MLNALLFYLIYIILFFSVVGYGQIFTKYIKINFTDSNRLSILSLCGIIFLTFISYITIFFTPHNYIFNISIHLLGFFSFVKNFSNNKNIKQFIFIATLLFVALLISKTHDDFAFYHLQQSLNFSQNKIQLGLSNLDFSYSHHSSILYLNSLFFFPYFKFYLFNFPNHIFFSAVIICFYEFSKNKKNFIFLRYYSFFTLIYILFKFTRISEFGTDINGQLLILLFFYFVFKFFLEKNIFEKNQIIIFLGILLTFLITIKTYFILYLIVYIYLIFIFKIKNFFNIIRSNYFLIIFSVLFVSCFFMLNLFTSCLLYTSPSPRDAHESRMPSSA